MPPSVAFMPGKYSTNCCQEFGCVFFNPAPSIHPSRPSFASNHQAAAASKQQRHHAAVHPRESKPAIKSSHA
jgi:hypothetical protein